jgi:peptidoglycan/xylan/chitin deacetylase (PgdA/CDA1 family)
VTKRKRSLFSAAVLVAAVLLSGFADGPAAAPVDCRVDRCVALTFDGGPGAHTGEVLDVLAEKNVSATFFVAGKGPLFRHPELVRRMVAEGHEVGNHTWTGPRLTEVPPKEARRQLVQTQEALRQVTGRTPTLMRPPRGRTDTQVSALCRELGLAQVLWDASAPGRRDAGPRAVREQVLKSVGRGGIVRLREDRPGTLPALAGIVDGLRERGFTPVSPERLFAPAELEAGAVYRHA